jgi:hypothetical protein
MVARSSDHGGHRLSAGADLGRRATTMVARSSDRGGHRHGRQCWFSAVLGPTSSEEGADPESPSPLLHMKPYAARCSRQRDQLEITTWSSSESSSSDRPVRSRGPATRSRARTLLHMKPYAARCSRQRDQLPRSRRGHPQSRHPQTVLFAAAGRRHDPELARCSQKALLRPTALVIAS